MPLLPTTAYNAGYFNGLHPAGYTDFSLSNNYQYVIQVLKYINPALYVNKSVLELGCAKGFLVHEMRKAGINARGIDLSEYAVSQADADVKPFLSVADVRNGLPATKPNTYDLIISDGLLECLTDTEAVNLANSCLKVARRTVFLIWSESPAEYYNVKTVAQWKALLPIGVIVAHHIKLEAA